MRTFILASLPIVLRSSKFMEIGGGNISVCRNPERTEKMAKILENSSQVDFFFLLFAIKNFSSDFLFLEQLILVWSLIQLFSFSMSWTEIKPMDRIDRWKIQWEMDGNEE